MKDNTKGYIDGNEGHSLWDKPLHKLFTQNDLPELFSKSDNEDMRINTLLTILVIENRLDHYLTLLLPKYKCITRPTLSTKIQIVKSFNLIPPEILSGCEILNRIRNKFAHDLDIIDISDINSSLLNDLSNHPKSESLSPQNTTCYTQLYKSLKIYTIIALNNYLVNIEEFAKTIYSDDLKTTMYADIKKSDDTIMDSIRKINTGETKSCEDYIITAESDSRSTIQSIHKPRAFKAKI
jgi:hypothetical protein